MVALMADQTSLLGKLLIGVFIFELIGILFVITIGSSSNPNGSTSQFTNASSGFSSFISLINSTTYNVSVAFSGCSFSTLSCSKPFTQILISNQDWFSGIVNAIIGISNLFITIIDLI